MFYLSLSLSQMMIAIEGMVAKTQKSLQTLKERVQIISNMPSPQQLYKQFEVSFYKR